MAVSPNKAGNMEGNIKNNYVILSSVFTGGLQIIILKACTSQTFLFLHRFHASFKASDFMILLFFLLG